MNMIFILLVESSALKLTKLDLIDSKLLKNY
jgi:hypothetical protein